MSGFIPGVIPGFKNIVVLGSETATADITGNWVVPDGVYLIFVECFGPGGSTQYTLTTSLTDAAGGGGGGAYAAGFLTVTPGQVIPYVAGASLRSGIVNGAAGTSTTFNGAASFLAESGRCMTNFQPTLVANAAGSQAQLKIKGGQGGLGGRNSVISGATVYGKGGDGGSAFRGGSGGFASPPLSAVAQAPSAAVFPGGGAGGFSGSTAGTLTAFGANGAIFVWY